MASSDNHSSPVDSFRRHSPHEPSGAERQFASNDDWSSVQRGVVRLFQNKKLNEKELYLLKQNVQNFHDSNGGSFMFEFYVKQLLTRGAIILREQIRDLKGLDLLIALSETWDYFYCEIVPTLQAIFFPAKPKYSSIRHASFLAFRDVVVLKVAMKEAIDGMSHLSKVIPASISQMLLILVVNLANVHDAKHPNEQRLKLEKLVAKVVIPYLSFVNIQLGTVTERQRLTRPLSDQNFRRLHVTVEDMYRSAYSKTTDE